MEAKLNEFKKKKKKKKGRRRLSQGTWKQETVEMTEKFSLKAKPGKRK